MGQTKQLSQLGHENGKDRKWVKLKQLSQLGQKNVKDRK
jgi:hypothetical protein